MAETCRLTPATREEWLALRRTQGIGGSEAAAVVGMSPWMSSFDLWRIKTGKEAEPDISDRADVAEGVRMEPALRMLFAARHPEFTVEHHPFDMVYQSDRPHSFSTLDGEFYPNGMPERRRVLEFKKCAPPNRAKWEEWDGGVPQHYYVQVLKHLLDTGYEGETLMAALIRQSGEIIIREYEFTRADCADDMAWLAGQIDDFWSNVRSGRIPPQKLTL